MTYLYAGMGIAMLTAIMAMFEMANGLTGQQLFARPPRRPYFQSSFQTYDKSLLSLVQSMDSSWTCKTVREELDNNELYSDIKMYQDGIPSTSTDLNLIGSCILSYGGHRVLIAPAPTGSTVSHRFFSCLLTNDVICSFEKPRS